MFRPLGSETIRKTPLELLRCSFSEGGEGDPETQMSSYLAYVPRTSSIEAAEESEPSRCHVKICGGVARRSYAAVTVGVATRTSHSGKHCNLRKIRCLTVLRDKLTIGATPTDTTMFVTFQREC